MIYDNKHVNGLNGYTFDSKIKPVSAEVYYLNDKPYLKYVGRATAINEFGRHETLEFTFPKLDLTIDGIEATKEEEYETGTHNSQIQKRMIATSCSLNVLVNEEDNYFTVRTAEIDTTKEEIENELGYKINIID